MSLVKNTKYYKGVFIFVPKIKYNENGQMKNFT